MIESADGILLPIISTPSNPPSGKKSLYFKSDGLLYMLNSSGVEVQVGGGASSDTTNQFTYALMGA
jgi:hypothetical protein